MKNENRVSITGSYTLADIKYDILKIIQPHDGYMYNHKDISHVRHLMISYLNDLRKSYKLREFKITNTDKASTVTFDIEIKIHRDRGSKTLKIHVGKLVHFRNREAA